MKSSSKTRRVCAVSLSALLCMSMIPFAGCAQSEQKAPGQGNEDKPISASQDPKGSASARVIGYDPSGYQKPEQKWASFDDGSLALDIVQTHVNANAAEQVITVKLENGAALASEIALGDVTLTGGLSTWEPVAIERVSDTELNITAQRGDSQDALMGTSIAGVSLAAACVQLPQADASEIDAYLDQMIAEGDGEELAEGFAEGGAESDPAASSTQPVAQSSLPNSGIPLAYAEETNTSDSSPYEAIIPFVHPSMLVDVEDTVVENEKTTYRIVASEFAFPENLTPDDFFIELASTAPEGSSSPKIESLKRLGDFEIEVVVAEDASKRGAVCDYAALHLNANASGTGGDVACALALPDAWVDAEVTEINDTPIAQYAEENADKAPESSAASSASSSDAASAATSGSASEVQTVTVNTMVRNGDDNAPDLKVGVLQADGTYHEVTDAVFENLEDGSVDVTVNADTLVDLAGADKQASSSSTGDEAPDADAALNADDVEGASLVVSAGEFNALMTTDSALFDMIPISNLVVEPLASITGGVLALEEAYPISFAIEANPVANNAFDFVELAKSGAKSVLSGLAGSAWTYVRSTWLSNTVLGEHTINQLYENIVKMQSDLSNIAATLDALSNKETAHYNASIVNAANAKIARIQSEYALIGGLYKQIIAAEGDEAATAAAIDNLMSAKKTTVDNLLVDMGELYNTIKVADASTGASLVKVYDDMASLSYNWGAAAAPGRQSYRDTISEVWAGCTTTLYVICGADKYKDEYSVSLNNLQNMTKEVNALLDSNPVKADDYERAEGNWTLVNGNSYVSAAGKAYYCYTTNEWYTMSPATTSTNGWNKAFFTTKKRGRVYDYASTNPFITWQSDGGSPSWGSYYLTTAQAKAMSGRLGSGRSLLGELSSFYDFGTVKYLVTDPSFSMKPGEMWHNESNWYFDTFEFETDKTSTVFTSNKMHFEGDVEKVVFKKANKKVVSSTSLDSMMAIAKVNLK